MFTAEQKTTSDYNKPITKQIFACEEPTATHQHIGRLSLRHGGGTLTRKPTPISAIRIELLAPPRRSEQIISTLAHWHISTLNRRPCISRDKSRVIERKRKLNVIAGFEVDVGTSEVGGKIGKSFVVSDE